MDFWIIITKFSLLIYLAIISVQSNLIHISWVVLGMLLYFCVNIALHIFNSLRLRQLLLVVSGCISIGSYIAVQPLFILLLPLTIIELTESFITIKILQFLVTIIPIFYLEEALRPLYVLVTFFCFSIHTILAYFSIRLKKNEGQLDAMRMDLQRLTKNLNENSEYIRQSEYTYRLEERNRISQEIHDNIGHSMTGALFQMEAAKRLIGADQQKATDLLQNAINISKDGIESIRLTLKNMKPPTEQVGIHRLKLLIDDYNAKHSIKSVLTYEGNLSQISPIQWKIIGENTTEALTNVMKYSNANLVSIEIKVLNKMVRVEVKDNGTGCTPIKKGLGIIGMEERTASVNGNILVDGMNGFSVVTLLPISS